MLALYRLSLWIYFALIGFLSVRNNKARQFIEGRKNQLRLIKVFPLKKNKRIWIHAASQGEFEQALPIIKSIKQDDSSIEIVLTFFSPSGYESIKNDKDLNHVLYLPTDSRRNASWFLKAVDPDVAIFIKYDFWYYFLNELQKKNVPTIVVSAIFRKEHYVFRFYGRFMLQALKGIDQFYVQDENSKHHLTKAGVSHVTVVGDTRFDRVIELASNRFDDKVIESFVDEKSIIVFGSIWPSDTVMCKEIILKNTSTYKFIVAPHNLLDTEISDLLTSLPKPIKYSQYNVDDIKDYQTLIIDTYGLLSKVYRYANIAYIGGGFNGTLHNTLEAAVYGIPIVFGKHTNNKKFLEAQDLLARGSAIEISDKEDFQQVIDDFADDKERYLLSANSAKDYVYEKAGATKKIMNNIKAMM